MRSVGLAVLVAATGCNQILGLHEPILIDASPDGAHDVATAPVRLTFIAPVMDASYTPQPPRFPAIEPAPTVQYGRLGGALIDTAYLPDGSVAVPADMGTGWRLVYTLAGEPPREVQFSSTFVPHVVVPYFGGADRDPLPGPNAVYQLAPTSPPASFSNVRVFTTGAWSERDYATASSPLLHDPRTAATVRGPLRATDPTKGDRVALVEYALTTDTEDNCVESRRVALFDITLANAPTPDPTPPMWPGTFAITEAVEFDDPALEEATKGRVRGAAGANLNDVKSHYLVGFTTGAGIPQEVFVRQGKFGASLPDAALPLPAPPMVLLAYCTRLNTSRGAVHADIDDAFSDAPRLGHVQLEVVQMTGGVPLRAGYTSTGLVNANDHVAPTYNLALAYRDAKLGTADIAPFALETGDVTLDASEDTLELSFELDEGSLPPDFYEVTLARISGSTAEPVRIYTVTERKVSVEMAHIAPGVRHVFAIRSIKGAPQADENDFTQWTLPQAAGLVWTRTFVR